MVGTLRENDLQSLPESGSVAKRAFHVDANGGRQPYKPVLAVSDPRDRDSVLVNHLDELGLIIQAYPDSESLLQLGPDSASIIAMDLVHARESDFEILEALSATIPETPVIVMTRTGDVDSAVRAMKAGAFDCVTTATDVEELRLHIRRALETHELIKSNQNYRRIVESAWPTTRLTPASPTTRQLEDQVNRIASVDSTLLITGESGTGKTTLARRIHQQSARSEGPFVAVNCAALPRELIEAELFGHEKGAFTGAVNSRPGRIEFANGGTLFLDEIGDLPLGLQPKLLTFLQERTIQRVGSNQCIPVDVRIIVATLHDLGELCRNRLFREDLYYRLNVLQLSVPPLRERKNEIPSLAHQILSRIAQRRNGQTIRLEPGASERLQEHCWPGNIRELENVLERAATFCQANQVRAEDIVLDHVSFGNSRSPDTEETRNDSETFSLVGRTLAEIEKRAILENLRHCNGNKALTARTLGISEKSIYNKMNRLQLRSGDSTHTDP